MYTNKSFRTKIYNGINNLCRIFMIIQVLVVSYVVFGRFVLHKTPSWGEELSLLAMVWFSLLSASLAVNDDSHVRIGLIDSILPKKILLWLKRVFFILTFLFALFMFIEGTKLVLLTVETILPGTGISSAWRYLSLPVAGLCLMVVLIYKIGDIV